MVGTEFGGDLSGVIRLVIGGDIETDRAGLHRLRARLAHQRDHARAIHPARQERAKRHIGHHPRAHALAQQVDQLRGEIRLAAFRALGEVDVPPALRTARGLALLQQPEMPRGKLLDTGQHGMAVRHIAPGHIGLDCLRVHAAAQQRVRKKALELGSKGNRPVRKVRDEQRLHPEPVAGEKQLALVTVKDRKGEHPVKPLEAIHAPAPPGGEDHLGVARGAERETRLLQLAAQFAEVVDLAVEDDHCAAIGRMHRLRRSGEVDDRQATMAEADPVIGPHPRPVRPPVRERITHPLDP